MTRRRPVARLTPGLEYYQRRDNPMAGPRAPWYLHDDRQRALDPIILPKRGSFSAFTIVAPNPRGNEAKDRARHTDIGDSRLTSQCWCQKAFVLVMSSDVRAGQTGTCGKPKCRPPEGAA